MDKGTALDAVKVLSTIAVSGLLASGLAWGAAKRCEAMEKSTAAKAAQTEKAKADPCVGYQKEALRYLERIESVSNGIQERSRAAVSVAYSSYYLVCRDLEKRK